MIKNQEIALITGANSFIGKHLIAYLRNKGIEVIEWGREEMQHQDGLDVPEHVDYIYNLAAAGSKQGSYSDQEIFFTNTFQVFDLLQATKDINYKAFIQFGSSSEYGIKRQPMREDDVLEPNFMYAATKAAATQLCRAYAIQHNKPIVTIRPFSVYGPGMQTSKLIPVVFDKIERNEKITLVDGNHDWIYIVDFLDAVDIVTDHAGELAGTAVNIGTGKQTSNVEVVKFIGEVIGKGAFLQEGYQSRHTVMDSPYWQANINTLKTLGWSPQISLRKGLEKMYTYITQYGT